MGEKNFLIYLAIRALFLPFAYLPYSAIHTIGRFFGRLLFYLYPKFRKRTLSNLSLAKDLHLTHAERKKIAIESCQNMVITALEYPKLARETDLAKVVTCINPQPANEIFQKGKGIVFFCAHQSNWELLFLDGTKRMRGTAIGRPFRNKLLYRWVVSIRQKFCGKIIAPKEALFEGMKALKRGDFLGIVGDQGLPDSGYFENFLGTPAWTSPMPAILAYRMNCPLMYATTRRKKGRYEIEYSDPIWPQKECAMETEVARIMKEALSLLEEEIKRHPGEWLWLHNRWKKQSPRGPKRIFRFDSICIVLPNSASFFEKTKEGLKTFREVYPLESITIFIPKAFRHLMPLTDVEVIEFNEEKEIFIKDYRFKIIFNFTDNKKVDKHFLKLSALKTVHFDDLIKIANMPKWSDFSILLKQALLNAP
jgi:Kdo2-lipid IVA lauroyltransferase/acyltransferase